MHKLIIPEYPLCKVINIGQTYSTYFSLISKFFPELSVLYYYVELQLPIKNKTYLLLGEHEHEHFPGRMVCVILDEVANQLFIVDRRGIEIIGDNNA